MPADATALSLVVRGFTSKERMLIDGTVRLSQRRTPRLRLLEPAQWADADVVLIDASDKDALRWASAHTGLAHKVAIWVDGDHVPRGHTVAKRPILWPNLPILLARVLEEHDIVEHARAVASAAAAQGDATSSSTVAGTVLVVDDSQAVRAHMRSILERMGCRVDTAASADAGMHNLARGGYALVFMDVMMPEIDGYEACKRIKAQRRTLGTVPIVMLTSRGSPFDRIRGKMAGCDGYLTKPTDTAALLEVLRRYVGDPLIRTAETPGTANVPAASATQGARPPTDRSTYFAALPNVAPTRS